MKKGNLTKGGGQAALQTHRRWLERARAAAQALPEKGGSPHPTVKVGAVLVGADGREIAHGANRFADGIDWTIPERYANGSRSMWFNCAEQMVLMKALRKKADIKGAKLYVTMEPCAVCAGLIAESGIKEVILPARAVKAYPRLKAKWRKSTEIGGGKLLEAGVKVTEVEGEEPSRR